MLPDKSLTEYLNIVKDEITRVNGELKKLKEIQTADGSQKQEYTEIIDRSQQYLDILTKKVERQYQPADEFYPDIKDAYEELNAYLSTYQGLLTPSNMSPADRNQLKWDDPKIILYLDSDSALRRFPFAQKFLIAIREEDVRQKPSVWASLAHEIGHFIYWNSEFRVTNHSGKIERQTAQINNMLFLGEIWDAFGVTENEIEAFSSETGIPSTTISPQHLQDIVLAAILSVWSEEIFADTLGVYLAGEEFLTESRQFYNTGRFKSDVDHPLPILRPYIAAKALENKNGTAYTLWTSLINEIKRFLSQANGQSGSITTDDNLVVVVTLDDDSEFEIDLETLKSAITKTIKILAENISDSIPFERLRSTLEFIEEFDDPRPEGLLPGTKKRLSAKMKKIWTKVKKIIHD